MYQISASRLTNAFIISYISIKRGAMHDRIRTAACKIIQYLFQRKQDKRNSIPAQAAQVHPSVPGRDS